MSQGGTGLTFLFTDVEGSTRLWEAAPTAMRDDLAHHDLLLGDAVRGHGGEVFKSLGDGVAAVFERPLDAVTAAVDAQRALAETPFASGEIRVRMGLHSGDAQRRDGDWFGPTMNRTARLHAVAHGGQIVVSGTTANLVAGSLPAGLTLLDLGEHRLRDLGPDRIHQITAPGLPSRFPPLRTEHHPSRGVPAPSGRLLGRAVEKRRLVELVDAQRIVTITGPPGGGKTRLAAELARDDRGRWPGGVWFCSLASLHPGASGAGGVAGRLADLLGSAVADGTSSLEGVVGALADRRALVVLDGCDHALDDAARVARAIHAGCPATAVLVTSRERLGLPEEHLLDLPTLADDDAVALFVARADAVRSPFTLAEHEPAVRSLIARLDGLPLAIELAAARVRTHSPAEIDALLAEHARVLRRPTRRHRGDADEAHHDLEAAIAWSHDLLQPADQRVFRHLGVFTAAFTAADVTELLPDVSPADGADLLDDLVERSLVALAPPRPTDRTTRYRLLRTLRAYAQHRLADHGEETAAWDRRAALLVARVEAAAARLVGPDEARWVGELADVWEDVRTLHARACTAGDTALAAALVAPLLHHSTMRGLEVGEWAERTLALPDVWDQPGAADIAGMAAEVRMRRGDGPGAATLAAQALAARPGDGPWVAQSTLTLVAYQAGDFALGLSRQQELHRLGDVLGDDDPLAPAVGAFVAATIMGYAGLDAAAEPALQLLDEVAAATGSPSIEAMARLASGRLLMARNPTGARRLLQDALELAIPVDNVLIAAQARWALAELAAADDPAGALHELRGLFRELAADEDEAMRQQALLRSLGPLVSLEADDAALLVACALEDWGWGKTAIHRAGRGRLDARTDVTGRDAAAARARELGLAGVADEVVAAIDRLERSTPARR